MTGIAMLACFAAYFFLLLLISRFSSRRGAQGNEAFFRAGRRSPWWLVAFGMVGASISGVTFISVPGWARSTGMTYLQMCLGFIVGYFLVAWVLLPLYYRLKLTSIYGYLGERFGGCTHRTGALFFVLSKLTGAAARLYLVCLVLQQFITIPLLGNSLWSFTLTTLVTILLIWLYTRRTGIQTIVRTDALQTVCLLIAAVGIVFAVAEKMNLDLGGAFQVVRESPMCRVWDWEWGSRQNFWRQFLSGIFIVVVMTGLDQDMMQKNLTCRTLREAQKNMCTYGFAFLPVNALFLGLGVLLYSFCLAEGLDTPASSDDLLPWLVSSGRLGAWVIAPFTIGIVASAFSSADSALTALTTTVCFDLLGMERRGMPASKEVRLRRRVHFLLAGAFVCCILVFKLVESGSVIDTIYVLASYTYGPLLGLYVFGLYTRRGVRDKWVPWVCVLAPVACGLLDFGAPRLFGYTFGYELLMLNGLLTFAGLWILKKGKSNLASA